MDDCFGANGVADINLVKVELELQMMACTRKKFVFSIFLSITIVSHQTITTLMRIQNLHTSKCFLHNFRTPKNRVTCCCTFGFFSNCLRESITGTTKHDLGFE